MAAYIDMRQSDLLELSWDDVVWEHRQVRVKMTMHLLNNGEYEHRLRTKNATSKRTISITDHLVPCSKHTASSSCRTAWPLVGSTTSATSSSLLLMADPMNVSKRFTNLAKKSGCDGMRFHDLRHTHATILLSNGVIVNVVSKRLGHANVETTLGIYGHVLPEYEGNAAARFDDLLAPKQTGETGTKTY